MQTSEDQQRLFGYLKNHLPAHLSLADELCQLLNISADSAYRRIRGEKPVTLFELKKICDHFQVSLDQVLQLESDTVVFRASDLHKNSFPFKEIIENLYEQVRWFNSFKEKHILYLCKDMPIWHFFHFPELAAFKTFFWAKTIHNDPAFSSRNFSLKEFDAAAYFQTGQQLIREYNEVSSVEIWNQESINSTVSQLGFYKEAGIFSDKKEMGLVIDSFIQTLEHLQLQAEKGQKFMHGDNDLLYKAPVQFYINEVVIGSNTILTRLDGQTVSFIPYNVFSFLSTRDQLFGDSIEKSIGIIQSRSTLISKTGEKERNKFFHTMKDRVHALRG
ncbi:MAG: helix-turn-helix domain-containing protein [Bacteroidetes bacterium]|nr:helix-turn-helix domain-containing protein [Bacteroidota bacterium]